jgi:HSP20 family protein
LTVHAEKTEEKREGKRSEFLYGSLTRSIQLPEGVKGDDIKASYDHGVLTVTAPTGPVQEHAKKIAISKGSCPLPTADARRPGRRPSGFHS